MVNSSSVRYYKKIRLQKKAPERYQNLFEEEKETKTTIWLRMIYKTFLSVKNKGWLSIEKIIFKCVTFSVVCSVKHA